MILTSTWPSNCLFQGSFVRTTALANQLTVLGCNVHVVHSGQEAVSLLSLGTTYDLAFVDAFVEDISLDMVGRKGGTKESSGERGEGGDTGRGE